MGLLVYIKMVPVVVLAIVGAVLLLLVFTVTVLTWKTYNAVRFVMGTVLALIFTVLLVLGSMYIYKITSTLSRITGVNTEIAQMGVYVRAEDSAASVQDASGYTYGILSALDRENTDATVAQLDEELGVQLQTKEYQGLTRHFICRSLFLRILTMLIRAYQDETKSGECLRKRKTQ